MQSFKARRGLLLTQLPLPDTVVDLWRLVESREVNTIVSLGAKDEDMTVKVSQCFQRCPPLEYRLYLRMHK